MQDQEYLVELRKGNEDLIAYLTIEKLLEMADLLIQEPKFTDNPERCFQLPFIACETLSLDIKVISESILGQEPEEESK